ncbi:hypothetical protein DYU11_18495 [Fibrisoma montanum]|uniref:Phage tail tape measure protein n=1 Tax=Fibrisoma montanum TaxID=2305895 RepID=A0A418M6H7_9BACT|nr:hypothetical protein [Fibrisoma montanum]RIV21396.1 hypothetical protein DYU11_18495 [Fibrisoma montanum]
MRYGWDLYVNDLMSSPLMKMANLYQSTVSTLTRGASAMAGSLQPVARQVDNLNGRLDQLRRQRNLSVNTDEVEQAEAEIGRLERRIDQLNRPASINITEPPLARAFRPTTVVPHAPTAGWSTRQLSFDQGAASPVAPLATGRPSWSAPMPERQPVAPIPSPQPSRNFTDVVRGWASAFVPARQSAEGLQARLDDLVRRRALAVDWEAASRIDRDIARTESQLTRLQERANRPARGFVDSVVSGMGRLSGSFGPVRQDADELNARLDDLRQRRALMVDASQIGRADRDIARMERQLARVQERANRPAPSGFFGSLRNNVNRFVGALMPAGVQLATLRQQLERATERRELAIGTTAIRNAQREVERLQRQINQLEGNGGGEQKEGMFSSLRSSALGYIAGAGLLAGAGAFFSSGMQREQTQVAYEQFLGKDTKPVMSQLDVFANKTPFENDQVYKGGQSLLSVGFTGQQLIPEMTGIGNMAAGAQKDFNELTAAYAKIKAKGFIDGGELHQEFGGTRLMDQLKANLGVNGEELFKLAEQRKIKFEDVQKAIGDLSSPGGAYGGAMDKQSQTAFGKFSTFLGTLKLKFSTWAAGFNDSLGKLFDFGTALIDQIDPFLAKLQPVFQVVVTGMGQLWTATEPVRTLIGDLLTWVVNLWTGFGGLGGATSGLSVIFDVLASVVWTISTALQFVGNIVLWLASSPYVQLIAIIYGAVRAAMMLNAAMMANPVGFIVGGIMAVVAAIKYLWDNVDGFRQTLMKLWEVAKSIFGRIGAIAKAAFTFDFAELARQLGAAWTEGTSNGQKRFDDDKKRRESEKAGAKPKPIAGPNSAFANNPFAKTPGLASAGNAADKDKKSGIQSGVTGAKSTNITINLKSLVDGGVHVHSTTLTEGLGDIERKVKEVLLSVLNSASSIETV